MGKKTYIEQKMFCFLSRVSNKTAIIVTFRRFFLNLVEAKQILQTVKLIERRVLLFIFLFELKEFKGYFWHCASENQFSKRVPFGFSVMKFSKTIP